MRLVRRANSWEWPTGGRPTTNCDLSLKIHHENSIEISSIHTWDQTISNDIHKCYAVFCIELFVYRLLLRVKVKENWKRITMLHSVESQTSCTDERCLLIVDWFLSKTWSNVFKDGKLELEIDMNCLFYECCQCFVTVVAVGNICWGSARAVESGGAERHRRATA